jgi:hypothetical protein
MELSFKSMTTNKYYLPVKLTMMLLFSAVNLIAHAQSIIIGAGSLTGVPTTQSDDVSGPIYRSTAASGVDRTKHHYLYTQAELLAAGLPAGATITSLSWNKDNTESTVGSASFEIWMKNSSLTTIQTPPQDWTVLTTGSTQVYSSTTQNIPGTAGFIDFNFGSSFTYTGDALEISTSWDISAVAGNPTTGGFSWAKDAINNRNISTSSTIAITTLAGLKTTRPQLKITYTPAIQSIVIGAGLLTGVPTSQSADVSGPIYRSTAASGVDFTKHHYLYTQAELAAMGLPVGAPITSLSWNKDNTGATVGSATFEIWMKNSSITTIQTPPQDWTALTTGSTQVYSSTSQNIPATTGFIDFTFGAPFTYTGGSLEISTSWDISAVPGNPTTAGFSWVKDAIDNRNISTSSTIAITTLAGLKTTRPQLKITYTTSVPTCTSPSSPIVTNITTTSANISWGTVSGVAGYEYSVTTSSTSPVSGTATTSASYNATSLAPGTQYYIYVRSNCGNGNYSVWVSTPFITSMVQSQTITFNSLPIKVYGDANFSPGATASSGLSVSYSSDNLAVATIVGGQIHINGAGTANITASQAGNANYLPAANVTQQLTVSKASLTVKADNKIIKQNEVFPTFTATYSGFVNGETSSVLTTPVAFSTTATNTITTGNYAITVFGASAANYTINYQSGTLTIQPLEVKEEKVGAYFSNGSTLQIRLYTSKTGKGVMQVLDVSGRILLRQEINFSSGLNSYTMPAGSLSVGAYIVRVVADGLKLRHNLLKSEN